MSSIGNWRNFFLQISCVISSCDKNIIFVCRWNITKLISAFSKSCSCISTDKYFVTSSSTSRGGAEIESMLVTDRTGQGRAGSRNQTLIRSRSRGRAPDLQISCKCKKNRFSNQHVLKHFPDVFNNFPCFQVLQNFVFSSTRFTKYFKKLLAWNRALHVGVGKSSNLLLSSLTVYVQDIVWSWAKTTLVFCEKKFCRSLAACAAVLAAAIAALLWNLKSPAERHLTQFIAEFYI